MNDEDERPEWWQVQIGNLISDQEALREVLDRQASEIRYWRHRARQAEAELELADEKLGRS